MAFTHSASDLPTAPVRIRQRAGQQIDSMVGTAVGSAGRVLGQAADIGIGGYRILGGLLARAPAAMDSSQQPQTLEDVQTVLAGSSAKPANSIRQAILRRGTNTSLVSAKTIESRVSKETELSDVKALGSSPRQDKAKVSQQLSSSATISSRLASLPGLGRLSTAPPASAGDSIPAPLEDTPSPGLVVSCILCFLQWDIWLTSSSERLHGFHAQHVPPVRRVSRQDTEH